MTVDSNSVLPSIYLNNNTRSKTKPKRVSWAGILSTNKVTIPVHESVTYPRYTVGYRLEKVDPNRTRITRGETAYNTRAM